MAVKDWSEEESGWTNQMKWAPYKSMAMNPLMCPRFFSHAHLPGTGTDQEKHASARAAFSRGVLWKRPAKEGLQPQTMESELERRQVKKWFERGTATWWQGQWITEHGGGWAQANLQEKQDFTCLPQDWEQGELCSFTNVHSQKFSVKWLLGSALSEGLLLASLLGISYGVGKCLKSIGVISWLLFPALTQKNSSKRVLN